jgi:hypothetical protein
VWWAPDPHGEARSGYGKMRTRDGDNHPDQR